MVWTVKQLARLSGVSIRTLHHYDAIGLLPPNYLGENGYRYYEREELLRLQQILFYRELGMPLAEIGATLMASDFNMVVALKGHRQRLLDQQDRYRKLIRTIDDTLIELRGDDEMTKQNPFEGFAPEKQGAYEAEIVERYGVAAARHVAQSKANVRAMNAADMDAVKHDGHQMNVDLVELIDAGEGPDSAQVQAVIERHYDWVCRFWTPDAVAYRGLGQLYLEHADFRAFYDKYDPRLVTFLAEAMAIYAAKKLA